AKARAAEAEANAKIAETNATATNRETADKKLKDAEAALPWYKSVFRDYSQPVGVGAGLLAAILTRGKLQKTANTAQQNAATAADTLMSGAPPAGTPVSQTNLGDRAGRVNEFWVNGQGRNPEQPFINDPAAPRGFRSNTDAPQSGDLYQPSLAKEVARNMV